MYSLCSTDSILTEMISDCFCNSSLIIWTDAARPCRSWWIALLVVLELLGISASGSLLGLDHILRKSCSFFVSLLNHPKMLLQICKIWTCLSYWPETLMMETGQQYCARFHVHNFTAICLIRIIHSPQAFKCLHLNMETYLEGRAYRRWMKRSLKRRKIISKESRSGKRE